MDEILTLLRKLNEPVPKPLRLPTEDDVFKVEKELNFIFPAEYRRFLLEASDVVVGTIDAGNGKVESFLASLRYFVCPIYRHKRDCAYFLIITCEFFTHLINHSSSLFSLTPLSPGPTDILSEVV